uniref:Phosphoglycerate mutase-like protein 4 n=1 Tax=Lotus japonicus TaxID=34305 RepID=I3SA43_LOTJA|nr:unknown [Lotus japonicus]
MSESSIDDSNSSSPHPDYAEIVVVRHGETAWNAANRIQGQLDVELNETGRQQAVAVADRLSRESKVSIIYSSDLQRAFETAQVIASKCGGVEVVKDSGLRERHLGDLQGVVYHEMTKYPAAYKAFMSKNEDQEIPGGGESFVQLFDRSTSALQRIALKHQGERVVVVTHGAFIRSLYRWACPTGKPAGKVLNTSISVFHLYGEDKWILKVWGDVSHLSQTGFLESGFGGDKTSG